METRQAVLTGALLVVFSVVVSLAQNKYELKDDLTKETWEKIQQLGDIGSETETLQQQYTGDLADSCRQQLPQHNYRAVLDKKLTFYRGRLEYDEKLLQSDLLKCGSSEPCKRECKTKHEHNMDACLTQAKKYIPSLKDAAIKSIKDFMDSCTSGKVGSDERQQKGTKKSEVQDNKENYELGDEDHW